MLRWSPTAVAHCANLHAVAMSPLSPLHPDLCHPVVRLLLLAVLALLVLCILLLWRVREVERVSAELQGLTRLRDQLQGRFPEALVAGVFSFLADRHGDVRGSTIVNPGDDLARDHRLAALDLEDAVLVIADRAGARLPGPRDLDQLAEQVHTVEDLLRFLDPFFRGATQPT